MARNTDKTAVSGDEPVTGNTTQVFSGRANPSRMELAAQEKQKGAGDLEENSVIKTDVDPAATANPGEINGGATAADVQPSGAISEREAVADIPMEHPAVDNAPRKGLPAESNRIDFNDPSF